MEEAEQPQQEPRGKRIPLVEIIIVLAVLAMVVVLLLPLFSLSSARKSRPLCICRLRQLATAAEQYRQDHDHLPGAAWHTALLPYASGRALFSCPDDEIGSAHGLIGYGYNAALTGDGEGLPFSRVNKPAVVGLFADAGPARAWKDGGGLIGTPPIDPTRIVTLCVRNAATSKRISDGEQICTPGVVVAYADGHAELISCTEKELINPVHPVNAAFYRVKKLGYVK